MSTATQSIEVLPPLSSSVLVGANRGRFVTLIPEGNHGAVATTRRGFRKHKDDDCPPAQIDKPTSRKGCIFVQS